MEDDWKAHDAAVSKVDWAHPEFGSIIASGSFDRTVKIWEQAAASQGEAQVNGNQPGSGSVSSRWVERAVLSDAKGTIRAVEFAPHHFGLKLVRANGHCSSCRALRRMQGNDIYRQHAACI